TSPDPSAIAIAIAAMSVSRSASARPVATDTTAMRITCSVDPEKKVEIRRHAVTDSRARASGDFLRPSRRVIAGPRSVQECSGCRGRRRGPLLGENPHASSHVLRRPPHRVNAPLRSPQSDENFDAPGTGHAAHARNVQIYQ